MAKKRPLREQLERNGHLRESTPNDSTDPRDWERELAEAGWTRERLGLYRAPCGCYFRGPWRAWAEMRGTHLADHIAAGPLPNAGQERT